jgi:hypothetical protein
MTVLSRSLFGVLNVICSVSDLAIVIHFFSIYGGPTQRSNLTPPRSGVRRERDSRIEP